MADFIQKLEKVDFSNIEFGECFLHIHESNISPAFKCTFTGNKEDRAYFARLLPIHANEGIAHPFIYDQSVAQSCMRYTQGTRIRYPISSKYLSSLQNPDIKVIGQILIDNLGDLFLGANQQRGIGHTPQPVVIALKSGITTLVSHSNLIVTVSDWAIVSSAPIPNSSDHEIYWQPDLA